jgi:hydrogenase expression/formation protein HypC
MKIIQINSDGSGKAELDGTVCETDFSLVDSPEVGDFVIIHAGFAIEKLDVEDAEERITLFRELADSAGGSEAE